MHFSNPGWSGGKNCQLQILYPIKLLQERKKNKDVPSVGAISKFLAYL